MDFLQERFPEAQIGALVNGDIEILVTKDEYLNVVKACLEAGYTYCSVVTAIDWKDRLTLIASLCRINPAEIDARNIHVKVDLPRTGAHVPSIAELCPGANFHERETYDMYGIRFDGHPNHRRILLPDNWQGGHPLLKDFIDKRPKRPRLVRHRYAE
ncbi:MAG TPA: NADH-quinone oxidoreductase subunit C [Symbiobacteriaceae bacterium]|nr:NADH-quinone oxidoreductase subunit C [Symbiobacteriaceae bacterium]